MRWPLITFFQCIYMYALHLLSSFCLKTGSKGFNRILNKMHTGDKPYKPFKVLGLLLLAVAVKTNRIRHSYRQKALFNFTSF